MAVNIDNESMNTLLSGTAGNDTIKNDAPHVTINGGKGNDSIDNRYDGYDVKIYGGAGRDSIYSKAANVTITGGAGNDLVSLANFITEDYSGEVYASSFNVIQYASGGGNDTVIGFDSNDTLHITEGKYSTTKSGNDFIVKVGKGKIVLKDVLADKSNSIKIKDSSGNVVTYNGNKVINGSIKNNKRSNVTLAGSENNDSIGNSAKNVLITGQAGNDSITNSGSNVTINAGTGNDSIYNEYGDNVTISGGAGNDSITNYGGSNVTINAGAGNDYIDTGYYNVIQFAAGNGNDTIFGFDDNDTLQITSGDYTTTKSGKDVIVTVGDDSVLLKNVFGKISIYDNSKVIKGSVKHNPFSGVTLAGSNKKDTIENYAENVLITGKADKDSIENHGDSVTIDGGKGNDSIVNYGYSVTIDAGAGNDSIDNGYSSDVSINAGAGNDTIFNVGENLTINAGAGNDKITLSGYYNVIQFAAGDGNDTIFGFDDNGILQITSGSYETAKSGSDVIVTVGDDSILLKNVSEKISIYDNSKVIKGSVKHNPFSGVTLAGSNKKDTIENYAENGLITGKADKDSIENHGDSVTIDASAGNDYIETFGTSTTIKGGAGNDSISLDSYAKNNVIQYNSGDGNDTIFGFNADDTLQITSDDYNAEASGNDVIFTVGTGTITLKDMAGKEISILALTKKTFSNSSALFAEDNLSEIVADKSVAEFEYKSEKFTQENLITFAK